MLSSIERFVDTVDEIYEFRVLGGDPFMSKDLHKVVEKLKTFEKVKKIIIYTNAKIIPKGENLECLKDSKNLMLDIANYGEHSSVHEQLLNILDDNSIKTGRITLEHKL
jgi:molybdenum cofactor biosynthesis enzyme MoaA